ncbi:MAG: hypothetical protein WC911_01645 [Thermoleophilia bacterium]
MTDLPKGINGVTGKEPIAAALAIGKKGPSGAPIERDRFHVLLPERQAAGDIKGGIRAPHPSFASFNDAPAERRKIIPARLTHATIAECFDWRRQAQQLPVAGKALSHPRQRPVCVGNGGESDGTAWRYDPSAPDFRDPKLPPAWVGYRAIKCPGDRCPFAKPPDDRHGPACKPWMRFLARFDWPRVDGKGLPNVPFKYQSGSWNTVQAFVGLFASFERSCAALGLDPSTIPLFGLPVLLQLQERTDASQQRRFPVVSISVAGDADIIGWITAQQARIQGARALPEYRVAGLLEEHPDDVAADADLISAGNIG